MFTDTIKLHGELHIRLDREDGGVEEFDVKNLITTVGKAFVASRMVGATPAVMSHMGVGTGSTPPAITDTALGAQVARVAFDSSGAAGAVVTYTATFGPGVGTGALVEAGLFNDPAAGVMLSRVNYPVVNKGASDTMSVTWTITVT